MKKFEFVTAAAIVGLLVSSSSAGAVCKKHYYTGTDRDPVWWQGRENARSNWSDTVSDAIGSRWARWSKARNADDKCNWLPTQGVNYCIARAQPCK
jgi:hypothetical protein